MPAAAPALPAGTYLWVSTKDGGREIARVRGPAGTNLSAEVFRYADKSEVRLAPSEATPVTFRSWPVGTHLLVSWGGRKYAAQVLKVEGDFHFITYPGWSASWDEWVMDDRITDPAGSSAATRTALVAWKGERYPAVVLEEKGGKYFIHYVGYGSSWDEWVGPDRVSQLSAPLVKPVEAPELKVGDAVQVEWKGQWYPAKVLALEGARARVHYDGFESSWDEWVGPERIRRSSD